MFIITVVLLKSALVGIILSHIKNITSIPSNSNMQYKEMDMTLQATWNRQGSHIRLQLTFLSILSDVDCIFHPSTKLCKQNYLSYTIYFSLPYM